MFLHILASSQLKPTTTGATAALTAIVTLDDDANTPVDSLPLPKVNQRTSLKYNISFKIYKQEEALLLALF